MTSAGQSRALYLAALTVASFIMSSGAASRIVVYGNASELPVQLAIPVTCQSVECVSLAAKMTSHMNLSADPCQDFFNFACGNFPNVVKYNPQRTSKKMSASDGDMLFEDTMGLMSEGIEKNIYELLVLDRVATNPDKDMSDLFNFTRLLYRTCRQWMHRRNGDSGPFSDSANNEILTSTSFLKGVFDHFNETLWALAGGGNQEVAMETVLAALVKTGGSGLLTVSLPRNFAIDVMEKDDLNLTRTPRARVAVDSKYLLHYGKSGSEKREKATLFRRILKFLAQSEPGAPLLTFAGRASSSPFPETKGIKDSLDPRSYRDSGCSLPQRNGSYAVYTVSDLDELAACTAASMGTAPFSWRRFFNELLQARVDPAALVQSPTIREVTSFVTYIKSRPVFANSTGDDGATFSDDVTFLVFDWLLSFQNFFPAELQSERLGKYKRQVVESFESDGVATCALWTKTLLQPILERMYQTAYHRKDFTDVTELVTLVKEAAIGGVRSQPWITPAGKEAIIRKINAMKESIGLDELSEAEIKAFYASTLDEYRSVSLDPRRLDQGFGTLFSLALCAYAHKNFDVMSGLSPVTMFMEINPLVVNAFNWVERNQIIFPMAILAPPYYHPSFPAYINLGSLGYVIGHEIGHSFDNIGHQIDLQGAVGHFWDNETESGYLERMECVRSRYGNYRLYPNGPLHSSNSTLGNDIADIIGIQAAVNALKLLKTRSGISGSLLPRLPNLSKRLSPEQQLFIQAAQSWCVKAEPDALKRIYSGWPSHSPHHLRVRGIAENSADFAKAFRCARGRPMNPEKKCNFW